MMVVEGNHEVEADSAGKKFLAYNARYRVPHQESGSGSPLYYSFDLAGETHIPCIVHALLRAPCVSWHCLGSLESSDLQAGNRSCGDGP